VRIPLVLAIVIGLVAACGASAIVAHAVASPALAWLLAFAVGLLVSSPVLFVSIRRGARRPVTDQSQELLETVIDTTPTAILLIEDAGEIEYANETARALFFEGKNLERANFLSMLGDAPRAFRDAVLDVNDQLFTVEAMGAHETYHLAKRQFELHGRTHTLIMVKHLTRELRRQEVDVWKKLIRVLSHELNNSLAPITSLVHSARMIDPNPKLERVFSTIEERARHLQAFVESYATFARLPKPRRAHVNLGELLEHVATVAPFARVAEAPQGTAYIDRSQLEQVVINLLKNAREAGGPEDEITLEAKMGDDGALTLLVADRGPGMSAEVLERATLPFYSTKERGTGLGLALAREIVEAHGGQIRLENRDGGGFVATCVLPGAERADGSASRAKLTLSRL
jgi:two-component system, NtrC family, nitrogen regulation sensor histidine kinase NtrY